MIFHSKKLKKTINTKVKKITYPEFISMYLNFLNKGIRTFLEHIQKFLKYEKQDLSEIKTILQDILFKCIELQKKK